MCLFQRVQIFTLNVFNQRHGGGGLISHLTHQHRHFDQTSNARSTETAFTSNDFVLASVLTLGQLAHQNRLHDALGLDTLGQLIERALIHACAWLILARHHGVQSQTAWQSYFFAAH